VPKVFENGDRKNFCNEKSTQTITGSDGFSFGGE
jgi:hypothetical protein